MSEWGFRMAEPADAEAFAKWVAQNPYIDPKDVEDANPENNPSVLYFVVTYDGTPVAFAPLYFSLHLAHLGFNPDAKPELRKDALAKIRDYVAAFAYQLGIRSITTLTKKNYPVAWWARHQGKFVPDSREFYKLDLNEWAKES